MDNEGVKEIADLAREGASATLLPIAEQSVRDTAIPLIAMPNGAGGVDVISPKKLLDEWRTAPERIRGTAKASTVDAFIELLNRHKSGDSAVFADIVSKTPSLTGVVDYHTTKHEPAWCGHRISYAFPISDEWKKWAGADGKPMSQGDWAAFIEDNVADLSAPYDQEASTFEPLFRTKFATPADLVTMSRGMEISVEARVKEVRTLQSGEAEVLYEEVHNDGRGQKLVVPGLFVVSIPLFVGGEKDRVICRLRYRKADGRILWFFQMYRPEVTVREYLERTLVDIGDRTQLPVFEAAPEA